MRLGARRKRAGEMLPAFLFLSACGLAVDVCFTFLAPETHNRPLELGTGAEPNSVDSERTAARPLREAR